MTSGTFCLPDARSLSWSGAMAYVVADSRGDQGVRPYYARSLWRARCLCPPPLSEAEACGRTINGSATTYNSIEPKISVVEQHAFSTILRSRIPMPHAVGGGARACDSVLESFDRRQRRPTNSAPNRASAGRLMDSYSDAFAKI